MSPEDVRPPLTPEATGETTLAPTSDSQPRVETAAFLAMVGRMLAAAGRRTAGGDPEDLAGMMQLAAALDTATQHAVDGLRAQGWSWAKIGTAAGMTRQSAYEKWNR